jgi:hypothetical protein
MHAVRVRSLLAYINFFLILGNEGPFGVHAC